MLLYGYLENKETDKRIDEMVEAGVIIIASLICKINHYVWEICWTKGALLFFARKTYLKKIK